MILGYLPRVTLSLESTRRISQFATGTMHRAHDVNGDASAAIRVVVIAARRLDGESLAALLDSSPEFHVAYATTSAEDALDLCRFERPDVILCDAAHADRDTWHSVVAFLRDEHAVPVLLLDDELNLGRLAAALQLPEHGLLHARRGILGAGRRAASFGGRRTGVRAGRPRTARSNRPRLADRAYAR